MFIELFPGRFETIQSFIDNEKMSSQPYMFKFFPSNDSNTFKTYSVEVSVTYICSLSLHTIEFANENNCAETF